MWILSCARGFPGNGVEHLTDDLLRGAESVEVCSSTAVRGDRAERSGSTRRCCLQIPVLLAMQPEFIMKTAD